VALEYPAKKAHDLRAEPEHQGREHQEAHKPTGEDRNQEITKLHLKHRGRQYKNLERRRRRQHGRKHKRPEFMPLKRTVNLEEAFLGDAFPQDSFAAQITDEIKRDAAQGRAQRGHKDIDQHSLAILIDIAGDDEIDRHAQQGAVGESDHKHAPHPEHLHQPKNPCAVAREKLSDGFQGTASVRDRGRIFCARSAPPAARNPTRRAEKKRFAMIPTVGVNMRSFVFLTFLLMTSLLAGAQQYDLVIRGGRVMDPETKLDAVRDVGIRQGRIARISAHSLHGKRVVEAANLVVAPGFIDLHQHGQELASQRVKAFDGVTSALEMELGAPDVREFLAAKQDHSLIHYGATASHVAARSLIFGTPLPAGAILPKSGPGTEQPASAEQIEKIEKRLNDEIDAGALGVGMGIQYTPGATRLEVIDMFRLAHQRGLPVYTHMRSFGRIEPGSAIEATEEVIGAAAITGAPLHIVHINSTCLADTLECLALVEGARARGLDVTTEAYPYIAGMTEINSAVFNPGWREKLGIDYRNLVLPDTGEHLTRERFEELHASSAQQAVLVYANTQEMVDRTIPHPLIMIASDGAEGHPRNAGTYARVLAEYVRQKKTLTLMEALGKMTLMPAEMLERSTPAAHRKGRLQEGADADIVVFDPQTISDRSTFEKPMEPSVGVRELVVGGVLLIADGKLVSDVYPGRAIVGPGKQAQTPVH
jgi:N-acyl-D-aspartate/D-glutamate deacylase